MSRFSATMGQSMQHFALTWQVYEVTGSALQIAFLGLARFVPSFLVSMVGGAVADMRDRRLVLAVSQIASLSTSAIFLFMTVTGNFNMPAVYVLSGFLGFVGSFENPARQSLLPQVVPPSLFQRAVAAAYTFQQLSAVLGPMAGGFIIYQSGLAQTYFTHVVLATLGTVLLAFVAVRYGTTPRGSFSIEMVKEGVRYVVNHKAVLGAMTIDLIAVLFAGAQALVVVYANDILHVGSVGFGMLSASLAVGSFSMALCLTFLPPIKAAGRAMVFTIVGFSVATVLFGLSTSFVLSMLFYALVGATDQVSVVMRGVIIQMGTPDELRGRVSAVNFVFIGASNQLSQVRAGLVADRTNAMFSVVSGGILCLLASMIVARMIPELWRYRAGETAEQAKT